MTISGDFFAHTAHCLFSALRELNQRFTLSWARIFLFLLKCSTFPMPSTAIDIFRLKKTHIIICNSGYELHKNIGFWSVQLILLDILQLMMHNQMMDLLLGVTI